MALFSLLTSVNGLLRSVLLLPTGHMQDDKNEWDPLGMLLERDEEETLWGGGSPNGQERSPTEEKVDKLIPCLGGTLQEEETPREEREYTNPGTSRSINTNGKQKKPDHSGRKNLSAPVLLPREPSRD